MRMLIATDRDLASTTIREMAYKLAARVSPAELHILRTLNTEWIEDVPVDASHAGSDVYAETGGLTALVYQDEHKALKDLAVRTFGDGNVHCHIRWAKNLAGATAELAGELNAAVVVIDVAPKFAAWRSCCHPSEAVRWIGT